MNLTITSSDPLNILHSTRYVLENAKYVAINHQAIGKTAADLNLLLKKYKDFPDHGHHVTGDFKTNIQLIFFESMVAFCFWAFPGKPKWKITLSNGTSEDGWYGVCSAFKRAYEEKIPVHDANFLAHASKQEISHIFRSANPAKIPLLTNRVRILNKNAKILLKKYNGMALSVIEESKYDAIKLIQLLLEHFPSYRDVANYNGHEVIFLKLAHILPLDLEFRLTPRQKRPFLENMDQLTVFADYKLPQILRMFGILTYATPLATKVDTFTEIPAGSPEEIEMRAGAIWGCELIQQKLPHYTQLQIGHVIWLMSQNQSLQTKILPYHRTYTTFY